MHTPNTVAPLAYSPADAATRLGVSLRKIYEMLATGELRSAKLGKRRLIPDAELQRVLATRIADTRKA